MAGRFSQLLRSMKTPAPSAPGAEDQPPPSAASSDAGSAAAVPPSDPVSLRPGGGAPSGLPPPPPASELEAKVMRSAAADAVESALATGRADAATAPPRVLGDALDAANPAITLDAAGQPQAPAETVTVYSSDPSARPRRCAAATPAVFAYGLRTGAVRLLARGSSERALAKGHAAPIVDIAFGSPDGAGDSGRALLATVDGAGLAGIWGVSGGGGAPLDAACAALVAPHAAAGAAPAARAVAWHPSTAGLLAVSAGPDVLLLDVASVAETPAADGAAPTPIRVGGGAPSAAGHSILPAGASAAVAALAFSPSGSHLAAGHDDGSVSVWSLPGGGDAADAVDAAAAARAPVTVSVATSPVTGAEFVPLGGRPVLVVIAAGTIALIDAVAGTLLSTVAVRGANNAAAPLTALAVGAPPPGTSLPPLAVASAPDANELVAITLSPDGRAAAAAARLRVAAPVLSAALAPASSTWATLLAVQPDAVNLLTVDAAAAAAAVGAPPRPPSAVVAAKKEAPVAPPPAPPSAPLSGASSPRAPPPPPAPKPKPSAPLTRLLTPSQLMGAASPRGGARAASGDAALRSRTASPAPPPTHAPVVVAPVGSTPASTVDAAAIAAIVRDEVRAEGARAAAAHEAAAVRLLDAAARAAADERAALVAAEHAAMEKVLATVSASVNRDLPARLVAELGGGAGAAPATVSPDAIAAALSAPPAAALLQGAVAAAVDAALPGALAGALPSAFRAAFEETIVPRFEAACREMFTQVQSTFAGGLADHLAAAGGVAADTAASLRETSDKLTAAVDTLSTDVAATQAAVAAAASALAARAPAAAAAAATAAPAGRAAAAQDPRAAVDALLAAGDVAAALEAALEANDVDIVASVAARVPPSALADGGEAAGLPQVALLALLQQLGSDLDRDTATKLAWVREAALALDPADAALGAHVKPTLAGLLDELKRVARGDGGVAAADASAARLAVHVVNSLLHQCA